MLLKTSFVLYSAALLAVAYRRVKRQPSSEAKSGDGVSMEGQGPSASNSVASGELVRETSYKYGRFEARTVYGGADGVISSFFLWKVNSWMDNYYWNELDFEKVGLEGNGECNLELNLINGYPGPNSNDLHIGGAGSGICQNFHDYAYEWTPDYVAWFLDGREVRRMTGWMVEEFNREVGPGMQFRFNIWPGDYRFGGNFNAGSLPLYQYIDWVRYSSYSGPGDFTLEWQEDFDGGSLPADWSLGSWGSPLGYSTHRPENVIFTGGMAVLALTPESQIPTNATIPPAPAPAPPTPAGSGGCCKFGSACNCGDDGTGWCNGSPSNCAVCTGTWDSNTAAPSCGGAPSPPSPSPSPPPSPPSPPPSPPTSGGQCCYGGGCTGCNGPNDYCSGSASVCSQCGGTYCGR